MLSFSDAQGNFIDTINDGPDSLHPALFAGPIDRVLLGLKAHANTISHARLVALEETFPLTRREMGEAAFNTVCRTYVETAEARSADANGLGQGLVTLLNRNGAGAAISDLAAIEWAWLESYHAADAQALAAADLAGVNEAALLEMRVAGHPSARIVPVHTPLASVLEDLAGQQPDAILTVRPQTEVRLVALKRFHCELLALVAGKNCTLGNLLVHALEQTSEQVPLEPVLHLIGAGALVKAG